ncbi:methylglyoxal synthase [Oscillospiraceae bacterium HV4-5-C5C]|nr:methylglyoxal synthase [Oscillospiraceae bacterium]MDD4368581.1 methylglyoxal synthase [Oscillospiraceae bacterium]NJP41757.1 methylglyoxal synthase [Oscillospiraceae bacterium HV4-5-C5C]
MKIVVIADPRKNELLVNFCIAYSQILANHDLYSLQSTAKLLENSTGLKVHGVATDIASGLEQFASRARFNEIDAVLCLRDPMIDSYSEQNMLMKACDINSIPYASNIAAAEILVLAIDRGDLDWRNLVH